MTKQNQNKKYVPLHAHNAQGSIGDALLKLKDYVKKAKAYDLPAIALTDHGTLTSMYAFNACCSGEGVRPIFGSEVYEVNDRLKKSDEDNSRCHLILLAKNKKGLKNLLSVVNNAYAEGFYYRPRTDRVFMKAHGEGIIGLSACVGGRIPQMILNYEPDEAIIETILSYQDMFDEFYLEIQPGQFEEQLRVNAELLRFSALTGVPLVVTNDVHYLDESDCLLHDAQVKIARKKPLDGPMEYADECYWFMDYDDVYQAFNETIPHEILTEALENTVRIADKCHVELGKEVYMPKFSDDNNVRILAEKCFARLEQLKDTIDNPSVYMDRILYELDTIEKLNFADYFLMVEDFVSFARSKDIAVGPGRGSGAGSLIAYLLDITIADSIKYDLPFERFLSVHRKGFPDIDMDFESSRRKELFDYAVEKYGKERCAFISTFMMRKSKTAIRDVARIKGLDIEYANRAAKLIPTVYYDEDGEKQTDLSIMESIHAVPELKQMYEDNPEFFETAARISDVPYATSVHPAGMIISPQPIAELVPIIPTKKDVPATALPMNDAESAGLLKMDFLSIASLDVYENTQKDVGIKIDWHLLTYDDEKTWDLIGSRYTTGLFQISSKTYKTRMPRLKPRSIQELANCLALLRGPCISSGADKEYMEILEGKRQAKYIHEIYYKVTKDTHGIILFQEQIMALAVEFGFTTEDSYKLMKGTSKKDPAIIMSWKEKFFAAAANHGAESSQIEEMWTMIEISSQYSFNRGHAVSYALLCYVSAYLKVHHTKHFLKNLLTSVFTRKEEIEDALEDCRRYGYTFLPPDVNKSEWGFKIEGDAMRMGFCAIKGFGEVAAEEVMHHRPYDSLEDFMKRVTKGKCSKRAMVPAIFSYVFSEWGEPLEIYQEFCELRKEEPLDLIKLQSKEEFDPTDDMNNIEPLILQGNFITGNVAFESFGFHELTDGKTFEAEALISNVKRHKTKTGTQMAFLTLVTGDGHIEATVFPNVLKSFSRQIKKNSTVIIRAKKDGEFGCVVNKIS